MDASQRGALMLVRFVAIACLGVSLVELALGWAEHHFRQAPLSIWFLALWCLVFIAGIVMLARAEVLAQWVEDKFE
jgi:hypothetical protein